MQSRHSSMLRTILCIAMALLASGSVEAVQPKIRMKMELVSIRNRSAGPVPVRVRLEYNEPQFLEGSLELHIHDAIGFPGEAAKVLTLRRDDIVLAGQDYEFILMMPPLNPPETRNWSIKAWFVTENERIPLSLRPQRLNPPEPFELLVTSFLERGMVLCSACEDPKNQPASPHRRFLETALSLDNYNPYAETPVSAEAAVETSEDRRNQLQTGKTVVYFASQLEAKTLPDDPLTYCAFDGVLLSDGGLAQLNETQLSGLKTWVRAGGSLCVIPDGRLQSMHLEFLRTVSAGTLGAESDLTLDSEGKLLLIHDEDSPILKSHYGIGRVVLLPLVEDMAARMSDPAVLGQVVAFLWKVRSNSPVWEGKKWAVPDGMAILRSHYPGIVKDETGLSISMAEYLQGTRGGNEIPVPTIVRGDRVYFDSRVLQEVAETEDLYPATDSGMARLESALLPVDVEMVPTSVIALILIGYVLAIGPVDYFVLGWLKLRKYTWIVFPLVTLLFSVLTIWIANIYMGSEDTGGFLEVTDLDENNTPVRQSRFETKFYGSSTEDVTTHRLSFYVQATDQLPPEDIFSGNRSAQTNIDTPMQINGTFPQNYQSIQSVSQWSPVTFRGFTLSPENVNLPAVEWSDSRIVTTPEGRAKLSNALRQLSSESQVKYAACVIHGGTGSIDNILGSYFRGPTVQDDRHFYYGYMDRESLLQQSLSMIANVGMDGRGFFSLVSQVSPEGAPLLEDLSISDSTDQSQKVLVIARIDGNRIELFRKRFFVEQTP